MHGARVIALRGNFDQALEIVREIVERHPVELVNSVNPYRIEGQKTAAFEVCDELGAAPDALAIPVGNAGNITAWWQGFSEYGSGAAPLRLPGRGRRAARARPAGRAPETVASAIRIGNPARWEEAMDGATRRAAGSPRSPTRDPGRVALARRERRSLLRAGLGGVGRRRPAQGYRRRGPAAARRSSASSPATASRTPTRRSARRPP